MRVGEEHVSRRRHMVSWHLLAIGVAFLALGATGWATFWRSRGILTLLNITYCIRDLDFPESLLAH